MPHVSIKPELLFEIFNFPVTNSYLTTLIVMVLLIVVSFWFKNQFGKKKQERSLFYYTINALLTQIYTLFHSVTGNKITSVFPLLATFFIFILIQNWFGLLPGVGSVLIKVEEPKKVQIINTVHASEKRAPANETKSEPTHFIPLLRGGTADLNMTFALGIIAVVAIQYYGIRFLGLKAYLSKFFNFHGPIDFFIGILEIVSELSRAFSFSFRLFGNIIAGEILLVIIAALIPVLASFPFLIMEIFVGLIQAVVFSTLAAIFIKMAFTESH